MRWKSRVGNRKTRTLIRSRRPQVVWCNGGSGVLLHWRNNLKSAMFIQNKEKSDQHYKMSPNRRKGEGEGERTYIVGQHRFKFPPQKRMNSQSLMKTVTEFIRSERFFLFCGDYLVHYFKRHIHDPTGLLPRFTYSSALVVSSGKGRKEPWPPQRGHHSVVRS